MASLLPSARTHSCSPYGGVSAQHAQSVRYTFSGGIRPTLTPLDKMMQTEVWTWQFGEKKKSTSHSYTHPLQNGKAPWMIGNPISTVQGFTPDMVGAILSISGLYPVV
mmetsp:Transcript_80146/g.141413  ORF Transcript_80146/g.141413 Transcript_80146/m.141413 type:complete len:108 (-) Transcript_80146:214-537(-)